MSIQETTETLLNSDEARKIHGISKPTFKKWLDLVKPERTRIPGQKGYFYQKNDMVMLEVLYLRALADEKAKKIVQIQEV